MDHTDFVHLQPELAVVEFEGMTPKQRWEQALALHATERWRTAHPSFGDDSCQYGVLDPAWRCVPGDTLANVVTCLSVLEHVPDQEAFLYHLSCVVAPGGLLVLTFPFWNRCGPDTAHGHQARQRIFCPKEYGKLRQQAQALHLSTFGGVDPLYHGPQVHDYTYASLVLEKRR
jgi:hypothetical protein